MVRTKVIANDKQVQVSLQVPAEYIGKELEVIAFTKEEGISPNPTEHKTGSFTVLHVSKPEGYRFNRDEANER